METTPPRSERDAPPGAPRSRALVVAHLLRDEEPDRRARIAERRLVRTVAEWPTGSGVDVLLRTTGRGGAVRAEVRPLGVVPAGWEGDVANAMADVAVLRGGQLPDAAHAVPTQLVELVRDPTRCRPGEADSAVPPEPSASTPGVAWPRRVHETDVPLLAALLGRPSAFVRSIVVSGGPVERTMLWEELLTTWDRFAPVDLDVYFGSPARVRTFVGTTGAVDGLATLRAVVRGWGTGLVLRDVEHESHRRFRELGADDSMGYLRPEGWAVALLRLPACGILPVTGMASVASPLAAHPIADVPVRRDAVALGTATGTNGRRGVVTIGREDLRRHLFIEGRTGTGKSTAITSLVASLSRAGIGCTLIEHHGTGVDAALRVLDGATAARAIVVRHGDVDAPAGLNLLAEADPAVREQMVAEFVELVQRIHDPRGEGVVGPRWRRWFSLLCDAVMGCFGPEATLLHVLAVASDHTLVEAMAARLDDEEPDLARRLRSEIVRLRGDDAANLTAWAVSKFEPLVSQRAMRAIVGRPRDAVDVTRLVDEGRTLLVDLAATALGTGSARTLGALWLLKHWVAMGRRADRDRLHVLIVDEAQLYAFGALPAMLAEARKFGIGVVIATQSIEALSPDLRGAVEANVGSFLSFRLGLQTAGRASARLDGWPARELVRLPDLQAAAALTRDGVQLDPFLLTVVRAPTDTADGAAQAAAVEGRCARQWREAAPHAVVTDDDVARALRGSDRPRRPAPDPLAAVVPVVGTRPGPSFVDTWLATRIESAPAQDPSSGTGNPVTTPGLQHRETTRPEGALMSTVTASATRSGDHTEPHRCRSCGRAFWGKRSWNGVGVVCPHCRSVN